MVLKISEMMSEDDDVFKCGLEVSCVSCHGVTYEGEIIAYDQGRRVLVIKCPSSLGTQLNDVHLINLNNTTNVEINKDVKKENVNSASTPHLDTKKIEERRKKAIEDRNRLVKAFDSGVTEEGLQVFQHLSKTLGVTWDGKDIVVQKDVVVSSPYKSENCNPRVDASLSGERRSINTAKTSEAVAYIKNLIDNYWNSKK